MNLHEEKEKEKEKDVFEDDSTFDNLITTKFTANTKARRVLIIDDDADLCESIKFIIESYGNSICDVVADPYEALLLLSDHHYDFVMVDQKMPGLKGAEVLARVDSAAQLDPLMVDANHYGDAVPVVLMSGSRISLPEKYKLKNFKLMEVLHKKDLLKFLSLNFAS